MRVWPNSWIGLVPSGRLSFGFVGHLTHVCFSPDTVWIAMSKLRFTDDVFDPIKRSMSGTNNLTDFIPTSVPKHEYVYMMVHTFQGKIRTNYFKCCMREVAMSDLWVDYKTNNRPLLFLKGVPIIDELVILTGSACNPYFLEDDKTWAEEEARLARSLTTWEKTRSILKRILCPPTSS